jgi:hypothetical protein
MMDCNNAATVRWRPDMYEQQQAQQQAQLYAHRDTQCCAAAAAPCTPRV